ncbi:MAG: hypothetical protein V1769_03755, partial [Thermoplasmatota archaeon]
MLKELKEKIIHKTILLKERIHTPALIKNHTTPGNSQLGAPRNSQSRRLKSPSSTMKTTTSSIQKNQEKNISYLRRFSFSQVRHLKTGS